MSAAADDVRELLRALDLQLCRDAQGDAKAQRTAPVSSRSAPARPRLGLVMAPKAPGQGVDPHARPPQLAPPRQLQGAAQAAAQAGAQAAASAPLARQGGAVAVAASRQEAQRLAGAAELQQLHQQMKLQLEQQLQAMLCDSSDEEAWGQVGAAAACCLPLLHSLRHGCVPLPSSASSLMPRVCGGWS
jgi:hypothetical protein